MIFSWIFFSWLLTYFLCLFVLSNFDILLNIDAFSILCKQIIFSCSILNWQKQLEFRDIFSFSFLFILKVKKFRFDLTIFCEMVLSSKIRTNGVCSDSLYRVGICSPPRLTPTEFKLSLITWWKWWRIIKETILIIAEEADMCTSTGNTSAPESLLFRPSFSRQSSTAAAAAWRAGAAVHHFRCATFAQISLLSYNQNSFL